MSTYFTHANGGRPFKVKVSENQKLIEIYEETPPGSEKYEKLSLIIDDFQKVFVGDDPKYPEFKGNSILVQITPYFYVFIGDEVYSFQTTDVIQNYYSPVGNSDVPYPYAIGENNTYLMIDQIFISNIILDNHKNIVDPYKVFYNDLSAEELLVVLQNKITVDTLIEFIY
jgi:hypothetical protein